MRYLCMHKVSPASESGRPPSQELIAGMGRLIGETAEKGLWMNGGGLLQTWLRLRFHRTAGGWTITEGPKQGGNELPAGIATIKVKTREEAIGWARRLGEAVGAEELELAPMTEPWHLGLCPEPPDAPLQFMIQHKATRATEAGEPVPPAKAAEFARLTKEMRDASVLTFYQALAPSRQAMRVRYRGGKRSVLDGPFAESKEMIGGFSMVEMGSREQLLEWTDRFARIIGEDLEVDLRPAAGGEE